MELILALLSLLTAASGALTGARAADMGVHQTAQVDTVRVAPPRAVAAVQASVIQAAASPEARRTSDRPAAPLVLASAVPLYADRLIE